ncbi:uncharacterized protein K02A2.6-like [Daphnia pulicaria]|uniref:uncharacterized protein K02A2.6-like n=1 Tax=Daphnia pulicaria TaxID=35523 RepID=UPI001EEA6403|nr:uncharacterized protein K02A2.6-like [Daphnia pulicaria]
MAVSLKFPDPFNFSASNLALEWEEWRTQFEWFITATRKGEKDENVLVGVLLSLLGREGLKIYGTFVFATAGDDKKIKPVLDRYSDYFAPLKSEVFDRFRFHKRHQKPGEPFDAWLVELRSMVKSCNYGTEAVVNSILRDQIVLGEATSQVKNAANIDSTNPVGSSTLVLADVPIVAVSMRKTDHYARWCSQAENLPHRPSSTASRQMAPGATQAETAVRQRPAQRGTYMQQRLHAVESEGALPQEDVRYLDEEYVTHELKSSEDGEEWHESLSVDGSSPIRFKLDSGATCNVLPLEDFRRVQRAVVLSAGPRVRNYGAKGGYLKVMGVFVGSVTSRGAQHTVKFVVVDEPGQPPILGLPTCIAMKLIKRVHAVTVDQQVELPVVAKEFLDVFQGIGKLPVQYDIKLATGDNFVDPVVCAAGRLPFLLEDKVYAKLAQMVDDGIIAPVVEPTSWLNKAIQRQHFSVPTVEQLFAKIGKAKYFCSLDAASGFYQIPLTEEASYLCTMATPKGRFRYLRLPFGLKSAPEVYLQVMSDLFGDLPGVIIYFDDFLVTGETKAELELNLRRVLLRCREKNLKLQLKKCRFFLQQLPWLGHVIGHGTLRPDPEKVDAIVSRGQ